MKARTASDIKVESATETKRIAATLGQDARTTRRRRRCTQAEVALKAGVSRARYAELERGQGDTAPLDLWVRIGLAIDRPIAVLFSRAIDPAEPADAGHLAAQELVLRLMRSGGPARLVSFELPTRPSDPSRSADICVRDDGRRLIIIVEIWNRLGDLGAAVRATSRKVADGAAMAALAGGDGEPYRVAIGWLLVDNAANRALSARYPEILRARFPGSSVGWVRSLIDGVDPPGEPALAWADVRGARLVPIRIRG
jgi:transcriptional regulator with XRE-family HTH domain